MALLLYSFSFIQFMLFSLSFFHLIAQYPSLKQHLCLENESYALLQFKKSFIIDCYASYYNPYAYPKVVTWNHSAESGDCCSWEGVECNETTGHVIGLDLSSSCLYGSINASSSLFRLVHLQELNLAYNDFNYSKIPDEFRYFSKLTYLNLTSSKFSGQIPSGILELSQLEFLLLSENNFIQWNMSCLAKLTGLTHLYLKKTNLYGDIPSWLWNFTQLEALDITSNKLHGQIPQSISRLINLQILRLGDNHFNGTLKFDLFSNLTLLWDLRLGDNNLSLVINPNLNHTIPKFKSLFLGSTNLIEIPGFLRNQDELQLLVLSGNKIHGKIPQWMMNVSTETLVVLDLQGNFLTGFEQPSTVLPWRRLEYLNLCENLLQGSIPIPSASIVIYDVDSNGLTGEIPPIICNLTSLVAFDISYNDITGMPLQCLGNFSDTLSILDLRNNHLHGTIPQTYKKGCQLDMIGLGGNQLEGQIPRSLANCVKLKFLDVGYNQINDAFPSWLRSLPELRILNLRSNKLHGIVEENETNFGFPKLRIIDISFNGFTGKLPFRLFANWISMKQVDAEQLNYLNDTGVYAASNGQVAWSYTFLFYLTMMDKGAISRHDTILDFSTAIDFSSNKFEGEIPQAIGSLKALRLLNLSNNALTGHIPPNFGNITALEALDLSNNKLSGEIPQELAQLTFLSLLNVSHNHLTGLIPQDYQFSTFENNSFMGNDGLCGRPLSKDCGGLKPSLPPASTIEEDEGSSSRFQFGWKIVVIGYACGLVIGGLIGHVVVSRKQEWFMRTFRIRQQNRRTKIRRRNNRT